MNDVEILGRTLHRLGMEEVRVVRQLADTLFVRLVQPFHQVRVTKEFDFRATMRGAMRTGHLLPTFVRREKTHPKSQLVIAMSLSGIDRCFAVGLIPLLSQLRRYLDFHLYIYTDDMVEAEFTADGFIGNDCDIAWNRVLAPAAFARLVDTAFDPQETKLLLIDSLGGVNSQWYQSITKSTLRDCRRAQLQFVGEGNPWAEVRKWLAGRYDLFDRVPRHLLPYGWEGKVASNTSRRWLETPALREYLIRYIFSPRYGQKEHGAYYPQQYETSGYVHVRSLFGRLKEKFKSVHVLTPSFTAESQQVLDVMKRHRFVDFHHRADSLEGFAQTLINIVYGRETDRLTTPLVRFANYVETREVEGDEFGGHSELTKTARDCFANCDPAPLCLPPTLHTFTQRKRGTSHTEDVLIPFRDIDVADFFRGGTLNSVLDGDWRIDPLWAQWGKVHKAESIINFIKGNYIGFDIWNSLTVSSRDGSHVLPRPEYERHRTLALQKHVEDGLAMYDKAYRPWFGRLPLRHVVWCTVGKFRHDLLAISACPADEPDRQRATTWHEQAHWAEHACPAIGVFTNALLQYLTGEFSMKRMVPVGVGEYAVPVRPGMTPWITDYAGKWYRRVDTNLPNPTEVFSVHAEYFRSPESLVELLEHDVFMAKAVAFIFMGGPLALLARAVHRRKEKALEEITQRERKAQSYAPGGRQREKKEKRDKGTDSPYLPPPRVVEELDGFGI